MGKKRRDDLPYEKFLQKGAESLTDAELLAILLRTGPIPGPEAPKAHLDCPALALAQQVLALPAGGRSGLSGLPSLSPAQLMEIRGIGEVKAVRLCCVAELGRRLSLCTRPQLPAFPDPATAAAYCRPLMEGEGGTVERVILLLLDAKGRLIHERVLAIGTVNSAPVSPREVFLQALKYQAVHFILLHNHPSQDVKPSREDAEITERLAGLGEMMQLTMLDHIIVGGTNYFSFREAGLL
ncbi:MAG TPA: DNA repair protein RadC [Candidatus Eisenbergiella merdigallinarum]|uniref:DNA repair protein RadC n=1 Tax=Candidatus Eisenbergiella merdigallinarum TaxID=2838552 RepID=A0A9D2MNV1_9FIRM|nr:DNA repair protein RadC [Candidatus Eisenbergiella merdigallinarum]